MENEVTLYERSDWYTDDGYHIFQGRVQICNGTVLGSVCPDSWDYEDAQVICRELGGDQYGKLVLVSDMYKQISPSPKVCYGAVIMLLLLTD